MKRIIVVAGILISVWVRSAPVHSPLSGQYLGVLRHDSLGREQLAKLDLIPFRSSDDELELKAVLTLHFGGYEVGEYVSYHYDKVRFDFSSQQLTFEDESQGLSIFVKKIGKGVIEGDVRSIWRGQRKSVGKILLSTEPKVVPSLPLIESLWGYYAGACGEEVSTLQIYTFRSSEDFGHYSQPFAGYNVVANLATKCRKGACVNFGFTRGSFNFFSESKQLHLTGKNRAYECSVLGDHLECSTFDTVKPGGLDIRRCSFDRLSKEPLASGRFAPNVQKGYFAEEQLSEKPIALSPGFYSGYVFHERLGIYQAADLSLNLFQEGQEVAKLSADARLYFGDAQSNEFIPYKFAERLFPSPFVGPQSVVLSRLEANVDAIIKVDKANGDFLHGVWHSAIYGRVGPFVLSRGTPLTLPEGSKIMQPLSGLYRGSKNYFPSFDDGNWIIKLSVVPGLKPSGFTDNPFFPNLFQGAMILAPVTGNLTITDGSYDFYTGRLGFSKDSVTDGVTGGDQEHYWIGVQTSREALDLYHVSGPVIGSPPMDQPERFNLVE